MIYGLQRKKKDMTRMIKLEEKKKDPYLMKIQSLRKAQQNCQKQINDIKKTKELNKKIS